MKTLIAIPCMDQVAAGFAQSLAVLNRVGDCSVSFIVGSLIYDSRNKLAKQAIEVGADYVLWLDSDMIFQPDTLEKLMEDDVDIVSGLYFRRVAPFTPVLFKELTETSWKGYDDYPPSLFEVQGVGFGCVLMKTEVLLDIATKYGNWFTPVNGYGEDLSFCLRAKTMGYKMFCDPEVKLGHVGHSVVTENFFKAYKGASK